jgi:hypothetical protein
MTAVGEPSHLKRLMVFLMVSYLSTSINLGDHPKAAIDDQVKSGHKEVLRHIW